MYLAERTFKAPMDLVDPETGIITLIEDARMEALVKLGERPEVITAEQRRQVTDEMTNSKDIIFRSSHGFNKDGVYTLRTVTLFKDQAAYKKHTLQTIGVPFAVNEAELDLDKNGLTVKVVIEEIKRK